MQVKQDAFDKIKRIMARDTLLTYPDFNETFKIHTDASAFQLGVVISQKGRVPAQDGMFALILWYVSKSLFIL